MQEFVATIDPKFENVEEQKQLIERTVPDVKYFSPDKPVQGDADDRERATRSMKQQYIQ